MQGYRGLGIALIIIGFVAITVGIALLMPLQDPRKVPFDFMFKTMGLLAGGSAIAIIGSLMLSKQQAARTLVYRWPMSIVMALSGSLSFYAALIAFIIFDYIGTPLLYLFAIPIYGGFAAIVYGFYKTIYLEDFAKATRISYYDRRTRRKYWPDEIVQDRPEDAQFDRDRFARSFFFKAVPIASFGLFGIIFVTAELFGGRIDEYLSFFFAFPYAGWLLGPAMLILKRLGIHIRLRGQPNVKTAIVPEKSPKQLLWDKRYANRTKRTSVLIFSGLLLILFGVYLGGSGPSTDVFLYIALSSLIIGVVVGFGGIILSIFEYYDMPPKASQSQDQT